jgi:hypothetical protein
MRRTKILAAFVLLTGTVLVAGPVSADEDTTPPVITITEPLDGTDFFRGDSIIVDFTCVDEVDPAPTCEGLIGGDETPSHPISSGDGYVMETADTYTLMVTAVDADDNIDTAIVAFTADEVLCGGQPVTVLVQSGEQPTAGPDVIQAPTNQFQAVDGLGGNDLICAGAGAIVEGGAGNDRLIGGEGRDMLFGGPGTDRLEGGLGRDRLEGDEGNDTLLGGADADRIEGGAGNDNVNGGPARDACLGQEGAGDRQAACEVRSSF